MFEVPKKVVFAVGFFFLTASVITVFVVEDILKYGEFSGYKIKVVVPSADGLGIGSPVVLSGVKIGEVSDISLTENGRRAVLTLSIKRGVKLTKDVEVQLRMQGVLGNRYVFMRQGSSDEYIRNGDVLILEREETELSRITEGLEGIFSELSETLRSLKALSDNLNSLVEQAKNQEIFKAVKTSIRRGGDMFSEGKALFRELREVASHLRKTLLEVEPAINQFSRDLTAISYNIKVASRELRGVFGASEKDGFIDRLLGEGTGDKIQQILSEAEEVTPRIKKTIEKTEFFISKIGKTAERVEELSEIDFSVGGKFEAGTEGKNIFMSQAIFSEVKRNHLFFNVGLESPPGENRISINSLLGVSFRYFDLGAGFLRSSPSFLLKVKPMSLLSLRGEVIGLSQPNIRGLIMGNIKMLSLYAGVENVFFPSKRFFLLGVELRR